MTKNLISLVASAVIVTAAGVGLVKSCVDDYYNNLPGVVYFSNGKKVIERRFKTNEEFEKYLKSNQGKKEREFYLGISTNSAPSSSK